MDLKRGFNGKIWRKKNQPLLGLILIFWQKLYGPFGVGLISELMI